MNSRWKRTTPPTPEQRLAQFHARLGPDVDEEELLRRQALGLHTRERMVQRLRRIPKHRSLVVVENRRKQQ